MFIGHFHIKIFDDLNPIRRMILLIVMAITEIDILSRQKIHLLQCLRYSEND